MHVEGDHAQKMPAVPNPPQKANGWYCSSTSDTFVDSTVTVYPNHVDYGEKWWKYTPLSDTNTQGERLWFNYTHTNVWAYT